MRSALDVLQEEESHFAIAEALAPVEALAAQRDAMAEKIDEMAKYVQSDTHGCLRFFARAYDLNERHRSVSYDVDRMFDADKAKRALDAHYWEKALDLIKIKDVLPSARREQMNEEIREHKCPEFELKTVRSNLHSLLAQRLDFLSEMIDNLFRKLSGHHVTNRPEAFSNRLIIDGIVADAMDICGELVITPGRKSDYFHDLRVALARIEKAEIPGHHTSSRIITHARQNVGQWHWVDGNRLRIRVFKKGTMHAEIHPDMAASLNAILAHRHPRVISDSARRKPAHRPKNVPLIQTSLPRGLLAELCEIQPSRPPRKDDLPGWYVGVYGPGETRDAAREIMRLLGGEDAGNGQFRFEYSPRSAINEIVATGQIPERVSHQFYPTQSESLTQDLLALADIGPGDRCLEPSAGRGDLAKLMGDNVTCVEISSLFCVILRQRGFETHNADFLDWQGGRFDRIVMNPPYTKNQAKAHIMHALTMLEPGGCLVAIAPASFTADTICGPYDVECSDPYETQFENTGVRVVILRITHQ